jgi:amino acid transporter
MLGTMDDARPDATPRSGGRDSRSMRALGLPQLVFQSVAYMAPAVSVVLVTLIVFSEAGPAAPISFAIAGLACTCVAVCVGALARELPSAGGLSTYVSIGLGRRLGFVAGWLVLLFLLVAPGLMFLVLAFVIGDFVLSPGPGPTQGAPPWWLWVLAAMGITLTVNLRGARVSALVTGVLGTIEIVVIVVLGLSILGSSPDAASVLSFEAGQVKDGMPTILAGAALAFVAFPGFDTAAYLAEDARRPRVDPPRAVLLAAGAITILYVFCGVALVVGLGGGDTAGGGLEGGNAWLRLASQAWGSVSIVILVALVSSALAAANAGVAASSRLVQALGRSAALPRALAELDPLTGTPHVAIVAVVAVGGITASGSASIFGLIPSITVFATVLATSALLAYLSVCPATTIFFARRGRAGFSLVRHGMVPVTGAILMATTLAYLVMNASGYLDLLGIGIVIAWAIVGVGLSIWHGRTGRSAEILGSRVQSA